MNIGYIGLSFILLFLVLLAHIAMRDLRPKLRRRHLSVFLIPAIGFTFYFVCFFSGLLLVMELAAVTAIYIPAVSWILKLPKNDHVA
jgi:hypothetical protein